MHNRSELTEIVYGLEAQDLLVDNDTEHQLDVHMIDAINGFAQFLNTFDDVIMSQWAFVTTYF